MVHIDIRGCVGDLEYSGSRVSVQSAFVGAAGLVLDVSEVVPSVNQEGAITVKVGSFRGTSVEPVSLNGGGLGRVLTCAYTEVGRIEIREISRDSVVNEISGQVSRANLEVFGEVGERPNNEALPSGNTISTCDRLRFYPC